MLSVEQSWLRIAASLLACTVILATTPVLAHKINLFAYAEGPVIHGQAYARGGDPVGHASVVAFDSAGEKLGEATTDEQGDFTLPARFRCDHRLVLDAGAGHTAEFTLSAEELPRDLPGRSSDAGSEEIGEAPQPTTRAAAAISPVDHEDLTARLESIDRQIVQLRKQLDGYEQKTRLHDVLGGLGYILGLMGLAYYFLGTRRKREE